ncbi:hypothetical protein BJY00DRAFT_319412 [Aspergillus carlsbadensis]|nr:hypothetical protein BJY00DRAFT_319412 [Aspergillus carlsbadensis]
MRFKKVTAKDRAYLNCIACGSPILECKYLRHTGTGQPDWDRKIRNRRGRCAYTSTADVEAADMSKNPLLWSAWYRAVIFDPKTNKAHLSGLACGAHPDYAPVVPTDPNRARLSGRPKHANDWNTEFLPIDPFHWDHGCSKDGRPYGFAFHADCWLLLGRALDAETVERDPGVFALAMARLWKDLVYAYRWGRNLAHFTGRACFKRGFCGVPGLELREVDRVQQRADEERRPTWPDGPRHTSRSPFNIPEIREVVASATARAAETKTKTTSQAKPAGHRQPHLDSSPRSSPATNLPLEIALEIIDAIANSNRPPLTGLPCDPIQDTRNILAAFHWDLPDSYWIKRCSPALVFEDEDLRRSGTPVGWAALCLRLEALFDDPHWYCVGGLRRRRDILDFGRCLGKKMRFILEDEDLRGKEVSR